MINIDKTEVFGWESAVRGMRNPMNSWDKSDSYYDWWEDPSPINPNDDIRFFVGENDLKLMKNLSKAGNDHAKYLRMINVTIDITAPLYWWKEFDTYKVGTVANSCSTMHKIHSKEFELDDFSHEHLYSTLGESYEAMDCLVDVVSCLNKYRERYLVNKDKFWWWQMIQLLPSSYNQKRTVQLNYAVLKNMYFSRRNHKLDEWRAFCDWAETLPYFKEICIDIESE